MFVLNRFGLNNEENVIKGIDGNSQHSLNSKVLGKGLNQIFNHLFWKFFYCLFVYVSIYIIYLPNNKN